MSVIFEEATEIKTKLQKPKKYNIWALNNDWTSFQEVVFILTQALGMNPSVAAEITIKVDREGKAKVNPKPMTQSIAQACLNKLITTRNNLAKANPSRAAAITELKFVIKED